MSLAKLPLRIATVLALRGRTWVGGAVFDSSILPMEARISEGGGLPFVVVYTDDSHAELSHGHDLTSAATTVDLVIHAAVATEYRSDDGGAVVTVARSDAGFEAQLDIIEAQIVLALQRGEGPWCELWRAFAPVRQSVRTRRGAVARKGARFAAREMVMTVETVPDPCGVGPEYPWSQAIDAFAAEPDTADLAQVLGTFVHADGAPEWLAIYRGLGMDAATARSFAFAAADGEILEWT